MNENDRSQMIFSLREACDYLRATESEGYVLAYQRERAGEIRRAVEVVLAQLENEDRQKMECMLEGGFREMFLRELQERRRKTLKRVLEV